MLEVGIVVYQLILAGTVAVVRRFWAHLLVGFLGYQLGVAASRPPAPQTPAASVRAGSASVAREHGQAAPKRRQVFIEAPGFHFDD